MNIKKVKQGAASFYVVAFSTLILLVIVASFTALVIAQITRSSNDDLSQSAYDSALAGVEDAKLAYYNYRNCVAQGAKATDIDDDPTLTCGEIITLMEEPGEDCDVVAKVLGRKTKDEDGNDLGGVSIDEVNGTGSSSNNMQQAYTCTKIQTSLRDYRATLSESSPMKAVQVKLDDSVSESVANNIKRIKISWGSNISKSKAVWSSYDSGSNKVSFPRIDSEATIANPPTIAFALVQAEGSYRMSDFDTVIDGKTNNGMVFLTPLGSNTSYPGQTSNYNPVTEYVDGINKIPSSALLKSNDKVKENLPYGVGCPELGEGEFACSAIIELPEPIDSDGDGVSIRDDDNFVVAVALPYGQATDFALEFFCDEGVTCGKQTIISDSGTTEQTSNQANLRGMQIAIDSTGRANDLFRRVETRLEGNTDFSLSIMGPLELFGAKDNNESESVSLKKDYAVTCEWNFDTKTCE